MMLGIVPITFRFRGKLRRLAEIYQCFLDSPHTGLHPAQISKQTGYSLAEVSTRLDTTPEMFIRLPKRPDGLTRYRLTSATAARTSEEVGEFLTSSARRETLLLYATGAMVLCILLIVVILVGPALEQS